MRALPITLLFALCNQATPQAYNDCNITDYYSSLSTAPQSTSKEDLHNLIQRSHRTSLPYTSSNSPDVWSALLSLDVDSSNQIDLIYGSRTDALPHDDGSCQYWNREHLWPRSRGVSDSGPDNTDLHHIRPVDCNVNSARGNKLFGSCGIAQSREKCVAPGHVEAREDTERDSFVFLPPKEKRGDIARSMFYMDLRYDGSEVNTLDLVVSDCPDGVPNGAGMGYKSQLLQWHMDDPVDDDEMTRNERICTNWQGNRNPFVDFPELVELYFGKPRNVPQDGAGYDCSIANGNGSTPDQSSNTSTNQSKISPTPTTEIAAKPTNQPSRTTPINSLIITGVVDGPLRGGLPKAIEIYTLFDISDLSLYGIGFANNGNGSPGIEFTFPPGASSAAGSFITISYEASQYTNFFGVPPDYVTGYASINGDDAIELYFDGSVVDVYGNVNVDGTGTVWDYMDGWAYRKHGSSPGTEFDADDWIVSGIDAFDSCFTNVKCDASFPDKTYQNVAVASQPSSASLGVRCTFSVLILVLSCFILKIKK